MITIDFKLEGMNGRYTDIQELKKGTRYEFYNFEGKTELNEFTAKMLKQIKREKFVGEYSVNTKELTYTIMKFEVKKK